MLGKLEIDPANEINTNYLKKDKIFPRKYIINKGERNEINRCSKL